jgi:pyrimidine-nucleoside phosphorylase
MLQAESPFNPVALIAKKRDGGRHTPAELHQLIERFMAGDVADYQLSAWLMAAVLQGLNRAETVALTEAMLASGDVLKLASVSAPKVDKHSTGGVGDKISLCLAPAVAACGVAVPMMSGRGLGHTGGTLDKLEAIPGYRVALDAREFERVVQRCGVSMIGQSDRLAPADRRIYALRDVTATVESIPLIVASILSKKLAEGIDALVLDVKVGRGAFMRDLPSARRLARALVNVGGQAGKRVVALLTDMSAPIGRSIGNALETKEALQVLHGQGPDDTRELTLLLGSEMLRIAGAARTASAGRARVARALDSGAAFKHFARMVEAHGGDVRCIHDPARLPQSRHRVSVTSARSGNVQRCDALELGLVATLLGAGRTRADQKVDPAAGIELAVKPGERVERGQPLAWLHVDEPALAERFVQRVRNAFSLGSRAGRQRPLLLGRVG